MNLRMRVPPGSKRSNKSQRGCGIFVKRKGLKTGDLRLARAGAVPVCTSLDSTSWKPHLLNLEESVATISITFVTGASSAVR
jgi:hypothetical protein